MSSPPLMTESGSLQQHENWERPEDAPILQGAELDHNVSNGVPLENTDINGSQDVARTHNDFHSDAQHNGTGGGHGLTYREKQVKPNKVYIGGLPEHTRREDLQSCFGKIGGIVAIELKLGYGFVEFDTKEAADESVAKYDGGFFMGNKIRVELSRGGRATKQPSEPGACFKCGNVGHWARECPHPAPAGVAEPRRSGQSAHTGSDLALVDRVPHSARDHPPPLPRDDYGSGRFPPRDRYNYDVPPPSASREYRRPVSPAREYRDFGPARDYGPPRDYAPRAARDYDDFRARGGAAPPPPPPRGYYPPDVPANYSSRSYDAPRDYDRGADRKPGPAPERYPPYAATSRPRTPPGPPPRVREEFERPSPRDYPAGEYVGRGRPITPPLPPSRYGEYPRPSGGDPTGRYRRRSQSPVPRSGGAPYRYANETNREPPGYPTGSAPVPPASYSGNGYTGTPSSSGIARGGGSARERDYVPRAGGESGGYARRG